MNILVVLHSTTGHTRLVAKHVQRRLRAADHDVRIHDIVKKPDPPVLDDVDLLAVAGPTMFNRASLGLERFVARLPNAAPREKPAFLFGTAAGEPGAHYAILAEILRHKGWVVLGARWVPMRANFSLRGVRGVGEALRAIDNVPVIPPALRRVRDHLRPRLRQIVMHQALRGNLRYLFTMVGSDLGNADDRDRDDLDHFVDEVVARADVGDLASAPTPNSLHQAMPLQIEMGRMMSPEFAAEEGRVTIDSSRCTACGTCLLRCPVGIFTRDDDEAVPTVSGSCTACISCINHCPEGAISNKYFRAGFDGEGQYRGPNANLREIFRD